jgi:hypothetical protein
MRTLIFLEAESGSAFKVNSWIRISVRIEVKMQIKRLKIEQRALIMDALMVKMEPWRGSIDQWSEIPFTLMRIRIRLFKNEKLDPDPL